MKKTIVMVLVLSALLQCFCSGAQESAASENEITVYAYDSFCGDWGPGEGIARAFEEATGIKVNLVSLDSAVDVYAKVVFEGQACPADVAIGMSDTMTVDPSLFEHWVPRCREDLIDYDGENNLVPFDYGTFSFIIDTWDNGVPVPTCLWDLTKDVYRKKIILMDPRTSSVGQGLLMWTISALGEDGAFEWWKAVKDNVLTVGSSWSSAYGLFTEHEAPLVVSYTTSPVYHLMYEDTDRYQAVEFSDGHLDTVEYLGILKTSGKKEAAQAFCEFVLTRGQADIAAANTMFPANRATVLDPAFSIALRPSKTLPSPDILKLDYYLERWTDAMTSR